nr:MAG TPA: hypothetical protein [Caudoviricetes sp.]
MNSEAVTTSIEAYGSESFPVTAPSPKYCLI